MGFEPTTSCLGSKDSTPELRPLAESNPTLANDSKSRKASALAFRRELNNRKFSFADFQTALLSDFERNQLIRV